MSMASEVMKLIFAVLDVSFNSGHYKVIIKRQLLYINYTLYVIVIFYDQISWRKFGEITFLRGLKWY